MYKKPKDKTFYKTRQIWVYFVCTLLLYTKVSASKGAQLYIHWLVLSTSERERSERNRTCSGIARVTHMALSVFHSLQFCSGEGRVKGAPLFPTLNSPSKVPSKHPSLWESHDPRLVSQWVQNKDTNRNDIEKEPEEEKKPKKRRCVLSPSSFFSLLPFLNVTGLKK